MATYTITPKAVNPERLNQFLGSNKVTGVEGTLNLPGVIKIITNENLTGPEIQAIHDQLDKIMPFGYTESVS